jgi:hypothetical protein
LLRSIAPAVAAGSLATSAAAAAPDVPSLLRKVGEAYGGSAALAECRAFRARGKIVSFTDDLNGTITISVSLEGAMRVEIRYPSRTETRILSGKLAWDGGEHRQRPSDRRMAASIRLQYHRLVAPFELAAADAAALEPDGRSDEGWIRLRRRWTEGFSTTYEIDPDSGRIPRTRSVLATEDGDLEFVSESYDFREVDGLRFPFRTTTWIGGRVAAETIFDRVTIEDEFPPTTFVPENSGGDM